MFTEKTRAAKDYSQGNRRTQGKIAKKAGKMRVFLERCGNHRWKCGSALPIRSAFACAGAASRPANGGKASRGRQLATTM